MAADTMAKFVAANATGTDKKELADLRAMDFEQLRTVFGKTAQKAIGEGKTIFELLRQQLPVYPV
jgi:hypothetical protein